MKNAKIVENFINRHPPIKECMRKGLINYSSLARLILHHFRLEKKNFDSILVASRRFARKLKERRTSPGQSSSFRIIKKDANVEIILFSKQKNPGFGPYLYSLLEENNINVESLQCSQKKVILSIKSRHLSKALELLN